MEDEAEERKVLTLRLTGAQETTQASENLDHESRERRRNWIVPLFTEDAERAEYEEFL